MIPPSTPKPPEWIKQLGDDWTCAPDPVHGGMLWWATAKPEWMPQKASVMVCKNGSSFEAVLDLNNLRIAEAIGPTLPASLRSLSVKVYPLLSIGTPAHAERIALQEAVVRLHQELLDTDSIPVIDPSPPPDIEDPQPEPPNWMEQLPEDDWSLSRDAFGRWIAQAESVEGATISVRDEQDDPDSPRSLYLSAPGPFEERNIELYARDIDQALDGCLREVRPRARYAPVRFKDQWRETRDLCKHLIKSLKASRTIASKP